MRDALLGLGLAAAILLNGAALASSPPAACAAAPSALGKYKATTDAEEIPAVTFVDADGNDKPLADFRGKGLILNFWATWCAPCVKEMPALDRLAAEESPRGLVVLAISADREGAAVVGQFYAANGIRHLPIALDRSSRAARALGIDGLPTTVLYDVEGREIGRVVGVAEWDLPAAMEFLSSCLAARG
jgi:thiol-disulfide isomerase/thioredoxin